MTGGTYPGRQVGRIILTTLLVALQGCVGLGAWTLGTRTKVGDHPSIQTTRGSVDLHPTGPEAELTTAADLRAAWGEPDWVEPAEDGTEEWIYKTDGLRWSGLVLYVVIIPLPAMAPVGFQYVSVLVQDGRVDRVTRVDWAFKGGAYCGYFGMMYGGLACGTGTFEEAQQSGPGS